MRYVTVKELNDMIRRDFYKIPHDIDIVVGIPRSGMLPANLIALYLNTRLSDIDSFVEGKSYGCGLSRGCFIPKGEIKKVLIVDDSIRTGMALLEAKRKLDCIQNKGYEFVFFVPIASTEGAKMVDLYSEIIDGERLFEWNVFHHSLLSKACVDIDGVLCVDPVIDDDGKQYMEFLQTAFPLFTPTSKINTLVSCRLEKYREQTEDWLKKNNVDYDRLIMLDFPDKATRVAWNKHGEYKGGVYKSRNDCVLFIESSKAQAQRIADISHKPVYCVETNTMVTESVTIKRKFLHAMKKRFPITYQRVRKMMCNKNV